MHPPLRVGGERYTVFRFAVGPSVRCPFTPRPMRYLYTKWSVLLAISNAAIPNRDFRQISRFEEDPTQ